MVKVNGYIIQYNGLYGLHVSKKRSDGSQIVLKRGFQSTLQAIKWVETQGG